MSKINIYRVELTVAEEVESGQRTIPELIRELQGTTSHEIAVAVNRIENTNGEQLYGFNFTPPAKSSVSDLEHLRRVIHTCNSFERTEALTRLLNQLEGK